MHRIDLADGSRSLIGGTGYDVRALAFDPDGQLFATDGGLLLTLSTSAGSASVITTLDLTFTELAGMAFDSNSTLWLSAATAQEEGLFQIDTNTGEATQFSDLGLAALSVRGNELYAISSDLVIVNLMTHSMEVLGSGFESWMDPGGPFGPFRNGSGADFDSSGRLWGLLDVNFETDPPHAASEIAEFGESGRLASTLINHPYGQDLYGLAITVPRASIVEIPALDTRFLSLLAVLLLLAGIGVTWRNGTRAATAAAPSTRPY